MPREKQNRNNFSLRVYFVDDIKISERAVDRYVRSRNLSCSNHRYENNSSIEIQRKVRQFSRLITINSCCSLEIDSEEKTSPKLESISFSTCSRSIGELEGAKRCSACKSNEAVKAKGVN